MEMVFLSPPITLSHPRITQTRKSTYYAIQDRQKRQPPRPPPSNSKWAKDTESNFIRNDAGQFGYETLTDADRAARAAKPRAGKKAKTKKEGSPRASKKAVVVDSSLKTILLSKKTYKQLAATELEKIKTFIDGLMDSAKATEKKALEKAVEKLQNQLKKLG